jgi:molecular chaperone DnaK (HSP70)
MATNVDCIVGIDLGTTNSEIAAFVDGKVSIIGRGDAQMLPSCVGISPAGELLIGDPARNQQLVYPERTVRSIKRKMGADVSVMIGDKSFTPPEISSFILRELAAWAGSRLGQPIVKAVITVPAYFSDAQRQATREAGALAGLDVVRVLNEPTAASLAYGFGNEGRQTVLVYDLGGGTFDVSIVSIEGDITEVLASHGNNALGGDDFDELIVARLAGQFKEEHGIDVRDGHPLAYSRLWWAAEEAKKRLSFEPYARIREEALVTIDGVPLHLDVELQRRDYEDMIRPLIESTLDSVAKALADAGKQARDLDAVLLVGGATRTPFVARTLEERVGIAPRQDVHPDLCVALGAGVLASRLAGRDIQRVLVDVSPYSFGVSYLGERGGYPYPHCYHPIIYRNTPLPITRSDSYQTCYPFQTEVDVFVYQGEDEDALKNILIGNFRIEGLQKMEEPNKVLCKMQLDLDGILHITAIEKCTGAAKHITIANALVPKTDDEIAEARKRLDSFYPTRDDDGEEFDAEEGDEEGEEFDTIEVTPTQANIPALEAASAGALLERSRGLLETMHEDDREEAIALHEAIEDALARADRASLNESAASLKELLFFIEGHQ